MEFTIKIWVTKDGGLFLAREKKDQATYAGADQGQTNRSRQGNGKKKRIGAPPNSKGAKRRKKILYHNNIPSLYLESQHRRHGEQPAAHRTDLQHAMICLI